MSFIVNGKKTVVTIYPDGVSIQERVAQVTSSIIVTALVRSSLSSMTAVLKRGLNNSLVESRNSRTQLGLFYVEGPVPPAGTVGLIISFSQRLAIT